MESLHTSDSPRKTFPKKERLSGKKEIQELFDKGSSFYLHPFLIKHSGSAVVPTYPKVLVSVPKRKFKKAVDRNKLKRRIKEAYRQHKHLISKDKMPENMAIIYTAAEKLPYDVIEKKLNLVLRRFQED